MVKIEELNEGGKTSKENDSPINKKEIIKALLKDVLYNSLAQAIIKIFLTPYLILKAFLFVFVVVSTSLASYSVIQSIMIYFSFGVSTTSRTIFEMPTLFPKVTFCNVNEKATEYAYNISLTNGGSSTEERKKFGHDLEDILIECLFNDIECDETNFTWSYDSNFGNCYTFNSGFDSHGNLTDLKQSTLAGLNFGLRMTLYVNVYEKLLTLGPEDNDDSNVPSLGAVVRIGNSSYLTDYLDGGIFLSPGFKTYINVDREFKSILSKPYSNCEIDSNSPKFRQDSDLYNLIAQSEYEYTQQLCFTQCLQKKFINKYNCTLYYLISLYNKSVCDTNMVNLIYSSNDSFDSNYINTYCLPLCPLECNQTLYKTSISTVQLNGYKFITSIKNNTNLAFDFINRTLDAITARDSFVSVRVYYESLSYISSTELPQMDVPTLLGSIGGNLGLFLGISVFSLYELVEVIVEIIFILSERKMVKPLRLK